MERSDLTPEERALVGGPGDLVDDEEVPARVAAQNVMFSLRIDRRTFELLGAIAAERGRRFSDIARDALRSYVDGPTETTRYDEILTAIAQKVGGDADEVGRSIAERRAPYQAGPELPKRRRRTTVARLPDGDRGR